MESPILTSTTGPMSPLPGNLEETFITTLRDRDGASKSDIPEPEGMIRVKELYGKIGAVVGQFNDKVSGVLQKQEKEFLTAYRTHMLQVQKELRQLRAKADEAELALKKNEKIRSLEDERNWYRKEALRLDRFATAMKKDLKYMKEKLESIEDDRAWLERQLKSSKKSNKLLRAELELRMTQGDEGNAEGGLAAQLRQQSAEGGPRATGTMFPPTRGASSPRNATSSRPKSRGDRIALDSSNLLTRSASDTNTSFGLIPGTAPARPAAGGAPRADGGRGAEEDTPMVERLEKQLTAERRTVKALRAQLVAESSQRAELERFFVKCVEDVKKDVARRRNKAQARTRRSGSPGPSDGEDNGDSIGMGELTGTDRRAVIQRLLSDDYVLQLLHNMIFGGGDMDGPMAAPLGTYPQGEGDTFDGSGNVGSPTGGSPRGEPASEDYRPTASISSSGGIALDPAVRDYLTRESASRQRTAASK